MRSSATWAKDCRPLADKYYGTNDTDLHAICHYFSHTLLKRP